MFYLVLSELVMLFICGGGKIGLIGEEEGDATEEIYLRGEETIPYTVYYGGHPWRWLPFVSVVRGATLWT